MTVDSDPGPDATTTGDGQPVEDGLTQSDGLVLPDSLADTLPPFDGEPLPDGLTDVDELVDQVTGADAKDLFEPSDVPFFPDLSDVSVPPDGVVLPDSLPEEDGETWADAVEPWEVEVVEPEPDGSCVDVSPKPWSRSIDGAGGTVVFTEIMYRPPADAPVQWVEIHNPFSIDMDLSGWRLADAVEYLFPEGTFLPPGGYLVVASDPAGLAQNGVPAAFGPWNGMIPEKGGTLELVSNGKRIMDRIDWSHKEPWPATATGSGASLAKVVPFGPSELAESWRGSAGVGGTPGQANFPDPLAPPTWVTLVPDDAFWRYESSGETVAVDWSDLDFDDSQWLEGEATFFAGAPVIAGGTALARFTADNFMALYVGDADGEALTYIGRDANGNWTTVEEFPFDIEPDDHLYVAAWEAVEGDQGPQMLIGEVELEDDILPTAIATWEWVLGPPGACPGGLLTDPAPPVETLLGLIQAANDADDWAAPAVEADKSSNPWAFATGNAFVDDPKYIWSDTFASLSMNNTQTTYVLFRTVEPLLGGPGKTELPAGAVTTYFRTEFELPATPGQLALWLDALVDDGAVFYLNGVEVLRLNMPEGAVGPDTFAAEAVDSPEISAGHQLPSELLVPGINVLAVEVHLAAPGDGAMLFGGKLAAQVWPVDPTLGDTGIRFNEIAAGGGTFWVELVNTASEPVNLSGTVVSTSAGSESVLAEQWLAPGEVALVDGGALGFGAEPKDFLYLYAPGKTAVLDAVRVGEDPRARLAGAGEWFFPGIPTPGEENVPPVPPTVVINELLYHHAPIIGLDGLPVGSEEEWLELHNPGTEPVDLSGWSLVDAIEFTFPEGVVLDAGDYLVVAKDSLALAAVHPELTVLGDYKGRLSNSGERVVLRDLCGNVVDEVRYEDGGRWPQWADGGGSSLELRDPRADNASPEAWAASLEGEKGNWENYTVEGIAAASTVGPDNVWQEVVLGLLDEGIVLLDDVSLLQDPDGAAMERLQNVGFEEGATAWRIIGNHRHSEVIQDPSEPFNHVLRLVSTGTAEHMHNHAETTLAGSAAIQNGVPYRLSFRARWMAGSNQLHTRLYFNRLPRTTLLPRPAENGTPGAPNSTLVGNLGPTWRDLGHWPAVPAPNEPVTISVTGSDPDGVSGAVLWYAVESDEAQSVAMTAQGDRFVTQLPGMADGTIVRFWVEGTDSLGATSTFPAKGADSRALFKVDQAPTPTGEMHTLRIIVTPEDDEWLFTAQNLMSNDRLGSTVIWDEREVFYDVGVRLKGSERGRPQTKRVGFSLRFDRVQPFRGVYRTVMVDRSEGVGFGQREMLVNLMAAHAGSVSAKYSDLIHVEAPRAAHTGPAELQLIRFEDQMLDFQFENGGDGQLYEYEYIYYPTTTANGSPEGPKLPQPDQVVGSSIKSLGADKENWRYIWMPKNNRWEDDFDDLMAFATFFGSSDPDFLGLVDAYIDVDQWLRAFALAVLPGAIDHYGAGNGHNAVFFVRPSDHRVLYFPHDLDFFPGSPTNAVIGHPDLGKLIKSPQNARIFYGHLLDIIQTTYNADYMGHWCDQLGALLPAQNFAGHCQFISQRAAYVLSGSSQSVYQAIPEVEFEITTNGGADVETEAETLLLSGQGWVDVKEVWRTGEPFPLVLTWTDKTAWATPLELACGVNAVELVAVNPQGTTVGSDSIVVTRVSADCP